MTETPDTPFVTGETFEQLQAKEVWVTPTGGTRQTLADALAAVGGGSVTEVVALDGPFLQGVTITTTGTIISSINPTAHGVLIGQGASAISATAAMANGQLLVGQTGANPLPKTISGDITVNSAGAAALTATGVVAGTYGDGTHVAQVDVDASGRVLSVTDIVITGAAPSGSAGGVLSGTYPNPGFAAIAADSILANATGSSAAPTAIPVGSGLGFIGSELTATQVGHLISAGTYTVLGSDQNQIVRFSVTCAVTLPQAGTSTFLTGWSFFAANGSSSGTVTITPTTSTINGVSSLALVAGESALVWTEDGVNYLAVVSGSSSGAAGGDLSGTYPDPTVAQINGAPLGTIAVNPGYIIVGNGSLLQTVAMSGDATIDATGVVTVTGGGGLSTLTAVFTANGTLGTIPAGAMILGGTFLETAGHTVSVSLGTGAGGAQVLSAVSVTASAIVPLNGPNFLLQSWVSDQAIFVASASWNSASVTVKVWYLQ